MNPAVDLSSSVKLYLSALCFSTLIVYSTSSSGEILRFKLSARNLPNSDVDGPSDPYAMVFTAVRRYSTHDIGDSHRHWSYLGSTSTKVNNNNPDWDETFQYQYINGTEQTIRVFVKDQDESWYNPIMAIDDPIGRSETTVENYMREMKKHRQIGNAEHPYSPIEMFMDHPVGGVLHFMPVDSAGAKYD